MEFREIIAINGMSGLYKSESQKVNGLIVTSLTEGWTKFISNREHLFSPLENISVFTHGDTVNLFDVMAEAEKQKSTNPPPDAKAGDEVLKSYFEKILPDYDKEKVHISDIRKFIKWFAILDAKGVIADELKAREEKEKKEAEDKKEDTLKSEESSAEEKTDVENNTEEKKEVKAPAKTKAKTKKKNTENTDRTDTH